MIALIQSTVASVGNGATRLRESGELHLSIVGAPSVQNRIGQGSASRYWTRASSGAHALARTRVPEQKTLAPPAENPIHASISIQHNLT